MLLLDRLANFVSGLGTAKDKISGSQYQFNWLGQQQLDAMFRGDWLARKIVEIVPFDMTREWRQWSAGPRQVTAIEEAEKALGVQHKVANALVRDRLYGGAAIFVGIKGQDAAKPLEIESVKQGSVEYLHVFSRWQLTPQDIERDPLSPLFGEPKAYRIGGGKSVATIHPSRVLRFVSYPQADPLFAQGASGSNGWGDSILQIVFDAIHNAALSQQTVASMLPEAKLDIIKVPNLSDHLSTAEATAKLTQRFALANQLKSTINALVLEGDGESGEQWEQKQIQFGQFPDLLRQFLQVAAGAADIPITRLLGQSPSGLNSTGESDLRNYYDGLASRQNVDLRPLLHRLDEILIRHATGSRPKTAAYEFRPLWQLTPKEKADISLVKAEATDLYASNGAVPRDILLRSTRDQLIEDGVYPGLESLYQTAGLDGDKLAYDPNSGPLSPAKAKEVTPSKPRSARPNVNE